MKRLLKPGGILLIIDLEMAVWVRDGSDPWQTIPMLTKYAERVIKSLHAQGIDTSSMPLVGSWLREMGGFAEVDDTVTCIPVGDWETDELQKEIGVMARDNVMAALFSTHPLWRRAGTTQEEMDRIATAAQAELYDLNAELFQRIFCVFARKEEQPFTGTF